MNTHVPLTLIGLSHKTAPVEIREKIALSKEEQIDVHRRLLDEFHLKGVLTLSTCNRTEVYLSGDLTESELQHIREWLDNFKQTTCFARDDYTYIFRGKEAVRHFFDVAAGLDSQVVGEPQITNQVKEAYHLAHQGQVTDALLNKLFSYGLQAQKHVRSETFLSDGAVSVSFAGVELAKKIFTSLADKTVLLIGAGETAELAALHFLDKGVGRILIANRTFSKASELANRFKGEAYELDELKHILSETDIVISATSATEYVLTRETVEPQLRHRRYDPLFLIDLAIPRDLDPELNELDNVYLYNLDDLNEVVQLNLERRKQEIPRANKIIQEHVREFINWLSTHASSQIIHRLKRYFDDLRKAELKRLNSRLPAEGMEQIDYLTESLVNKILHQHIQLLKKNIRNPELYEQYLEFLHELYEIDK